MDIFNEYIYVYILMAAICGTQFVVVFDVIYVDTTKHVKLNLGLSQKEGMNIWMYEYTLMWNMKFRTMGRIRVPHVQTDSHQS